MLIVIYIRIDRLCEANSMMIMMMSVDDTVDLGHLWPTRDVRMILSGLLAADPVSGLEFLTSLRRANCLSEK